MNESEITEKLKEVVRPHLKFLGKGEAVTEELNFGEAGLDSMASIDLLLDLEQSFSISISDEALTENTFQNLASLNELVADALSA
ncbi:MAG: phosphopantetheine-binding protein [Verrucomicrobiota bacterium]